MGTGKILFCGRPGDLIEKDGATFFRGRRVRDFMPRELTQPVSAEDFFNRRVAETGDTETALAEMGLAIVLGLAFDCIPHIPVENGVESPPAYLNRRSAAL